jgi:hypothetical protein
LTEFLEISIKKLNFCCSLELGGFRPKMKFKRLYQSDLPKPFFSYFWAAIFLLRGRLEGWETNVGVGRGGFFIRPFFFLGFPMLKIWG